jgi:hypothetical protein
MLNLKLELFNYRKKLDFDQEDISKIVESNTNALSTGDLSEMEVISNLNSKLNTFKYDKSVKSLLENINTDLADYQLQYQLKHLYKVLEHQNLGMMYRQPMVVLLDIINLETDNDKMSKILNELCIYDWVPEIKTFVYNLTKSPDKKQNLLNGGKSDNVYTIVEQVENGHIARVKDSWFFLSEGNIEKTLVENHVNDPNKIRTLRTLETALNYADINESTISFRISEDLVIGLSVDKSSIVYINGEEMDKATTLESIFSSPIIPIINKNFYPLILEVSKNLDKFIELDIVKKITNLVHPQLELYAFNYKNSIYTYKCDERYGNSFFKYESVMDLINEIKSEVNYDLSYFYNNKLSKEVKVKRQLEDKERQIKLKLEEVNFNIEKIKANEMILKESNVLKDAMKKLNGHKANLENELEAIKELQYKERVSK